MNKIVEKIIFSENCFMNFTDTAVSSIGKRNKVYH